MFYNARMKTLIWDSNGTILDDVDIDIEIESILLDRRGMPRIPSKDWYLEHFRFPVKDYYYDLGYTFDDETYEDISVQYQELYRERIFRIPLNPGVEDKLQQAHEQGYRNVIISASEQNLLELQLKELGIRDMFDAVIGIPDMLAVSKVEQAKKWMKADGVDPDECIYIGDTDHDVETAHALGIERIYLVSFGHQAAHLLQRACSRVVDSFDEVVL